MHSRHRRRCTSRVLRCAGLALALLVSLAASPPVIDRVLAVVSGSIVTLSDVNAAVGLGLVNTAGAADPIGAALEQLIERALMLAEVERYAPPEPDPAAVDARVQVLRARLGSEEQFQRTLVAAGLTEDRLRAIAREDLRLESYLSQRFGSMSQPADEEVVRYYRQNQNQFVRNGVQQPLTEVEGEVRARLEAARRAALVEEWSRQLRQRGDVLIVPR